MSESNRTPFVRTALPSDAEVVVAMAAELAAAVADPTPDLDAARFVRDGFGPDRWFECLVVEIGDEPIGFALICRGFEAHTGKRRLWLGDLYVRAAARRSGAGRSLMAAVASRALDLDCEAVYWECVSLKSCALENFMRFRSDCAIMGRCPGTARSETPADEIGNAVRVI